MNWDGSHKLKVVLFFGVAPAPGSNKQHSSTGVSPSAESTRPGGALVVQVHGPLLGFPH